MSTDLATWLRAQLDVDEEGDWPHRPTCQMLRPVPAGFPFDTFTCNCDAASRWIAEVEAKRAILDEHSVIERKVNWVDEEGEDRQSHLPVCVVCVAKYSHVDSRDEAVRPCRTVRWLALPYADRPGYLEGWRP